MTAVAEHYRDDVYTVSTSAGSAYIGKCACGFQTAEIGNKGAAGFSLGAHVKKANGQSVFAKKADPAPDPVPEGLVERALTLVRSELAAIDYPVLPATLVPVPSLAYRVHNYKSIRGVEGDAFEGDLQVLEGDRWRTIGSADYDGWGGPYRVQFADGSFLHETVNGLPTVDSRTGKTVIGYAVYLDRGDGSSDDAKAFVDWALTMPGVDDLAPELGWNPMAVLGLLVDEAALWRELMRKKNTVFLKPDQNPRREYGTVNTRDHYAAADYLRKRGWDGRIWHAGEWVSAADVKR